MDFLDLIHTMQDLNEKIPNMRWNVEGTEVVIRFEISDQNAEMLDQAKQMFSPM